MPPELNKIVQTYKKLAAIPALAGAKLCGNIVTSKWSQRNIEKGKSTSFSIHHYIDKTTLQPLSQSVPIEISTELVSSNSPLETYRAVLRDVDNKEKEFLEVWSKQNLIRSVDLNALDLHGKVYTDGEFCSFDWSPDETKLLYIAEKKKKKSEPFYKRKVPKDDGDKEISIGEEYAYVQDWGEQLVGKKQSAICIYNFLDDTVTVLEGMPEDVCPSKVIWSPDGTYLVGVALKTIPRKLGLIYCSNRESTIFTIDLKGNYAEMNLTRKCVKSPRFTPDGKHLIWLQRSAGGPHASCMALYRSQLPLSLTKEPEVVINIVFTKTSDGFYGCYNTGFARRCWTNDGRLILTSPSFTNTQIYVVNLDKKTIKEIPYSNGSQAAFDIIDDYLLISRKNFTTPEHLLIGKMPPEGEEQNIVFRELTQPENIKSIQNSTSSNIILTSDNIDFNAIYIGPQAAPEKSIPLIVWPHGGPHSVINNGFYLEYAFLLSMGYAVLPVNYRGSLGAGEESVKFLTGKVGKADVADCVLATQEALKRFPWLNPNRVMLCGGSHGGFLVTHLAGQHPDMYRAVVTRNPVIDIASMSITSDIPDWCYVEAGKEYTQIGIPDEQLLLAMRKASPIQYAHQVKAPVLLQIGSKDLRVPPTQGMEYYHRLKANGTKTKMNLYDDNHPLGGVLNEMDNLINTLLWFEENAS